MSEPDSAERNDSALAEVLTDAALAGLAALAYFGTADLPAGKEDTDE